MRILSRRWKEEQEREKTSLVLARLPLPPNPRLSSHPPQASPSDPIPQIETNAVPFSSPKTSSTSSTEIIVANDDDVPKLVLKPEVENDWVLEREGRVPNLTEILLKGGTGRRGGERDR